MTPIIRKVTPNNIDDIVDDLALLLFNQQPQTFIDIKDIIYNYLAPNFTSKEYDESIEKIEKLWEKIHEECALKCMKMR